MKELYLPEEQRKISVSDITLHDMCYVIEYDKYAKGYLVSEGRIKHIADFKEVYDTYDAALEWFRSVTADLLQYPYYKEHDSHFYLLENREALICATEHQSELWYKEYEDKSER